MSDDFSLPIVFDGVELFRIDSSSDAAAHRVLELVKEQAEAANLPRGRRFYFELPPELVKVAPAALFMCVDQFAPHYGVQAVEQIGRENGSMKVTFEKL